jgi:hypothetical protein
MNHAKTLLMSAGAAALSLGFSLQPHPAPFCVIAAEETSPQGNVQTQEDSSAANAKMGKDEGTQTGGAIQGTPPDTQKVEQPPRENPTTSE